MTNEGKDEVGSFIYVFSTEDMEKMLAAGYSLMKADEKNNMYIFADSDGMSFDLSDMCFVRSNTLTF